MKKLVHRVITITLSFVLLFLAMPFSNTNAAGYEDGGIEFMDETDAGKQLYSQEKDELPKRPDGSIPPQWMTIQSARLYINYKLWKDRGILCYGSYKNVPGNNFKAGTQQPGRPEQHGANDGYYANPYGKAGRGEWRYHGYDVSGNRMTNIFFIPDSVVTKFDERDWVKDPWERLPNEKRIRASIYNDAANNETYDPAIKAGVQSWINKSMSIYGGVPLLGSVVDPEVFRYLNVESAPTITRIGQGRMWHRRPDNSIWYQTVVVPVQKDTKKDLPVNVELELLTKIDKIQDLGTFTDNTSLTLQFKVTATLSDEEVYDDTVKSTVYYTRNDIEYWNLSFNDTDTQTNQKEMPQQKIKVAAVGNTGSNVFTFKTTYGLFRKHNWDLYVTAKGEPVYKDTATGNRDYAGLHVLVGTTRPQDPPVRIVENFAPDPDIPEIAFDGVPFDASDKTDMSRVTARKVFVDGNEVDGDYFFSGSYKFQGSVGMNGRFAYVDCEYQIREIPGDAGKVISRDVVYIYPTKPIANFEINSGTWKQNRTIKVRNTCGEANIQLVIEKYPITEYEWSYGGDTRQLRKGADSDLAKELLYKEPGIYSLTLRCKNTLDKWSDPYTVKFQVLEDIAPAVGVNLSESVYTRNDKVSAWYYCISSTDGDDIESSEIELWYDSDNDGTLDRKLRSWSNQENFPEYTPVGLGYYKYILKARENIAGDTIPEYITETDRKTAQYEVEFWVDNYRPLSDIYVNIPIQRPSIDVCFMLDKNLDTDRKDYILNNRVNISNWLLGKNIIPNVHIWDLHTYTYSQPANTTVNTGGSYPSQSVDYTSNGYSGALSLSSVTNNSYSRDKGSYKSKTESKTATGTGSGYSTTTYTAGKYGGWSITSSSSSDKPSISYSDGSGFRGTLYKTSYTCTSDNGAPSGTGTPGSTYTRRKTYSATYKGTVYRTVQVWVPNIVWYNNYTGEYTGTIYKNVKQPYTDNFTPTAQKYVIYISDSIMSESGDLEMVLGYAVTAKLFIAGTSGIKSQHAHDKYFDVEGKSVDVLVNDIVRSILENSPAVEKYYTLQNQQFVMNVGQIDLENDAIVETGMQYVHEPAYYDNPTGTEPGSVQVYGEKSGWIQSVKDRFANTGKYTIYRRVKDRPTADPNFSEYSYYSGSASIEVYVVRKPLAMATLDWDYDNTTNTYKTKWADNSYDPDHQYSRADKGIVDRSIMWRKTGGPWNYGIPDHLSSGSYELNYYVLDPEGYWSDPFVMNFTLDPSPSMQFAASLRTLKSSFSLSGVPASEDLEAYDIWTRYPRDVRLEMALYSGAARVTPLKTVNLGSATGTRLNNDITWENVIYKIPATLADRIYDFRISAIGDDGKSAVRSFPVNVSTPLDLAPSMPPEVSGGTAADISAETSKYAESVNVDLFHGTAYKRSYSLVNTSGGSSKAWEAKAPIPGGIPDGNYVARFTAVAPNGNTQSRDMPFRLVNLAITGVDISGYWNHWRGQVDMLGKRMTNEPHRFLSLECVKIDISTIGDPERVTVRFSPELEAMEYTDPNGHTYDYGSDFFGSEISFPADSTLPVAGNHAFWEYHLPLAPSSKSWSDTRLRPQYRMTVTAYKGADSVDYVIGDIDITGNIYDLTYIQPKD